MLFTLCTSKKIALLIFIFALVLNVQFFISISTNMDIFSSSKQLISNIFKPTNLFAITVDPGYKYEMHIIFCSCGNGHYSYGFNCRFYGPPYECSFYSDYCFCYQEN